MVQRKPLVIFATIILGSGLWLGGCGEVDKPLEVEEEEDTANIEDPDEEDPDVEEPNADDPDVEEPNADEPDVEEPDLEVSIDFDQEWGEPQGLTGGSAARLFAAGDAYFAVQRDSFDAAQLWRAESGDDWNRIYLPEGEEPARIVDVVSHDGDLYIFAENLLRSQDGGITWQPHQWTGIDATELATARVFDDELYVLAGPNRQGEELYRVADGEAERVDDGLPDISIADFAIYQDRLLISRSNHRDGLMVEGDSPGTWEPVDVTVDQAFAGVQFHLHDGRLYATAEEGIWRSSDAESFEKITDEPAKDAVLVADRLIVGPAGAGNSLQAIDLSDSTGATPAVQELGGYDDIYTFSMASNGESIVASTLPDGLLHMDLNTNKWQQISPTLRAVIDVAHTPQRDWILSGGGNIYSSTDDGEWTQLSLGGLKIESMLANEDRLSLMTRDGEFLTVFQDGDDWSASEVVELDIGIHTALLEIGGGIFAAFAPDFRSGGKNSSTAIGGGLHIAPSPGVNSYDWSRIGEDLPEEYTNTNKPPIYAMHGTDDVMVAIGHDGIFRSTDLAASWSATSVEGGFVSSSSMSHKAWLTEADGDFFAMTANEENPQLLHSQDDGESWTRVSMSLPDHIDVTDLHSVGSVLMIGTSSRGVLGSADGGQSWEQIGVNFRGGDIRNLRTNDQSLWATTSRGILELSLEVE